MLTAASVACGSAGSTAPSPQLTQPTQTIAVLQFNGTPYFVSPDTSSHQGYATDGVSHWTIDTSRIDRRSDADAWPIIASNSAPFFALSGLNHLGDGDVAQGRLYVVAESWTNCGLFSGQRVLVFNASTLHRTDHFDISSSGHEASGLAVDAETDTAFVASFCDANRLFKYRLSTFEYLGDLRLSIPVANIQGIAFGGGYVYASSDASAKAIYRINVADGEAERLFTYDVGPGSYEGVDVSQHELRWLIDVGSSQKIFFFGPVQSASAPVR